MGNMSDWELINDLIARVEVPGGWLYRTTAMVHHPEGGPADGTSITVALCFVPDPELLQAQVEQVTKKLDKLDKVITKLDRVSDAISDK